MVVDAVVGHNRNLPGHDNDDELYKPLAPAHLSYFDLIYLADYLPDHFLVVEHHRYL